ncbi:unnamed protein product [Trichobilharzia regenti]|nr:unnamed protein product [Trichobilharzia regenti]
MNLPDDQEAMDFVASAAVIRSQVFHSPGADQLTRFTIKSLAGNIIPAVASTNAIVAGLMVLQARHILSKHYEVSCFVIFYFIDLCMFVYVPSHFPAIDNKVFRASNFFCLDMSI